MAVQGNDEKLSLLGAASEDLKKNGEETDTMYKNEFRVTHKWMHITCYILSFKSQALLIVH